MKEINKDSALRYNEIVKLSKELDSAYDPNYDPRQITRLEIELKSDQKDPKDGIEYKLRRES